MPATLHIASVTNTGTGKRLTGFVICVDGTPLVAVDALGFPLHGGGRESVLYSGQEAAAPAGIYSVEELAEDYSEATAAKPLVGVTFRQEG